jgi:hypothetical protein
VPQGRRAVTFHRAVLGAVVALYFGIAAAIGAGGWSLAERRASAAATVLLAAGFAALAMAAAVHARVITRPLG